MRTREARVAECVIVTVAASHKGRAALKAQTTGRLAVLLAGEQINDILTIQADALVNAAVQHCLTEHREILCVRIQTRMTCNTAVCHPCVAIVALADQRVIAPAIEFAEGIQIGGAIVAEARMTDLIDHSILIRVAERSCCKIIGGKAVFQRQIGRTLEVQRLVDFVLNVLVHIAARDTLHEEAQHLETEVAVLFLTGCEHQFTVADIIQHLGFVLINVQEHSFPLRKTRSMGQQLMNGDILFAILRKFRDVACYGRIEVDLSFAVQLHDGLGRGHDLRAGCHIEHGVHLHGTGIIQTNAHVIQHCISIGFFIDDPTTARHNDGRTREVALPHVVFHNGIDGGQSRILLDGHSRGLEAVFGLFRACAACKCSGDSHGPHGLSGCDHKAAARDLFHGKLSFSSKKLKRLYHFRKQKYFIQYFVFLFQKKHLHILMQMLFSFSHST